MTSAIYQLKIITEPELKLRVLHKCNSLLDKLGEKKFFVPDENGFEFIDFHIIQHGDVLTLTFDIDQHKNNEDMYRAFMMYVSMIITKPHIIRADLEKDENGKIILSPKNINKIYGEIQNCTDFLKFIDETLNRIVKGINKYIVDTEFIENQREIQRFEDMMYKKYHRKMLIKHLCIISFSVVLWSTLITGVQKFFFK